MNGVPSLHRKLGSDFEWLWAIFILPKEHDIISHPEFSYVELRAQPNHPDCYWELIQARQ